MKITDSKIYFDIQLADSTLREELINNIAEVVMNVFPHLEIKLTVNSNSKEFNSAIYYLRGQNNTFDIEIGTLCLTAYISSYQVGRYDTEAMLHRRIYLTLTPVWEDEEEELELILYL